MNRVRNIGDKAEVKFSMLQNTTNPHYWPKDPGSIGRAESLSSMCHPLTRLRGDGKMTLRLRDGLERVA
jgi:hypothetical protein